MAGTNLRILALLIRVVQGELVFPARRAIVTAPTIARGDNCQNVNTREGLRKRGNGTNKSSNERIEKVLGHPQQKNRSPTRTKAAAMASRRDRRSSTPALTAADIRATEVDLNPINRFLSTFNLSRLQVESLGDLADRFVDYGMETTLRKHIQDH